MFDFYIPIAIGLAIAFLIIWCWTCRPSQGEVVVAVAAMMAGQEPPPPPQQEGIIKPIGLDKETIDSYPMVVIGESGRMLQHDDNTCPICLIEYLTKDTLKILPQCLHRFHSHCLDEWFASNGTCPVCRVQPSST